MWQLRRGVLTNVAALGGGGGGGGAGALDGVASLTGAFSFSRDLLTAFAGGTKYTDTAGAITSWNDQSGSSRHLTDASTSVNRPALSTLGTNTRAAAAFNGSDDILQSVGFTLDDYINAGSGAVVFSASINAITSNTGANYQNHPVFADQLLYAGLFARLVSGTTPTVFAYNYDGNEDYAGVTLSVGTGYVFMWRHDAGTLYCSLNGGSETSSASGNTQVVTGAFRLGGPGVFCNMTIAELFTTADGSQTATLAAAIANMKAYVGV